MVHDRPPGPVGGSLWEHERMPGDRRLPAVVAAAVIIAAPALMLRLLCVGRSCERRTAASAPAPFCSLPPDVRAGIAAGYRDGRSPDLLAVTSAGVRVAGPGEAGSDAPWPSVGSPGQGRVPLVFWGNRIRPGAEVAAGTTLDSVAPTLASAIGVDRPHPEVRSGRVVPDVVAREAPSRLALIVVWRGIGGDALEARPEAWPVLKAMLRQGSGTLDAEIGSLPADPAAVLTTVGTGGLPRQHGITGAVVRNDAGEAVEAWGPDAPFSVIAALGDDLDQRTGQAAEVGLVGTAASERGLIGGTWYVRNDRDDVRVRETPSARDQAAAAERLLGSAYGRDRTPDLLAVTMEDDLGEMDRALGELMAAARRAAGDRLTVAVTATGTSAPEGIPAADVVDRLQERAGIPADAIVATVPGGFYLDPIALADAGVAEDRVTAALKDLSGSEAEPLMADAFSGFAVSLEEYC